MTEVVRQFEFDVIDGQGVMRRRLRVIGRDQRNAEHILKRGMPGSVILRCDEIAKGKLVAARPEPARPTPQQSDISEAA
ncbi:hypothetical protein [Mucisphaera sp.]|uniref:hypothetical protein n=1 Tax=Mucisphaera sp. TaxID=2913024 RepID=UPI003D0A652D